MNDKYGIIRGPLLTEKGTALQESHNQVTIRVAPHANKIEILKAVEALFNVKVDKVRTVNRKGKKKRLGRFVGQASDWKKAIVSLSEGSKIDFLAGL